MDDWTYAYQKHLLKHDFVRFPNGSDNYYYCCNQKELHKKDVQNYLDKINQFDSFDGYFNDLNHLKLVNFNNLNWNTESKH